jgi:hypothetical protein
MAQLRSRCETAKPLGLVRCDNSELLVVYDGQSLSVTPWFSSIEQLQRLPVLGCYMTKQGTPGRSCGYIRWETKATSYAHYGPHVLLFSSQFIEVRHVNTGRLDQVIEANDIRLLHSGPLASKGSMIMAVMAGKQEDGNGVTEKIVELQATASISHRPISSSTTPGGWEGGGDEWGVS